MIAEKQKYILDKIPQRVTKKMRYPNIFIYLKQGDTSRFAMEKQLAQIDSIS